MNKVPFLVGPTASGKTAVSLIAAEKLGARIISADSRQIYRGMAIGTAQPRPDELARVPHHFVGCLDPEENFSAGEYGRQARAIIAELLDKGIVPLVVGGSGLYISALADDFFSGPAADSDIRAKLREIAKKKGSDVLHRKLQKVDSASAGKIIPSDYRRIERALEVYYLTGIPISELRREKANPPPYTPVMAGLEWPRDQLYDRINARCLRMLEDGLIEEVKTLIAGKKIDRNDFWISFNALNSVGYVEVIEYLQGHIDYAEMVRLFQRKSRRFAKRQIAWFGRDWRIRWIKMDENISIETCVDQVLEWYREAGI